MKRTYHRAFGLDPRMFSVDPAERLEAARAVKDRVRRSLEGAVGDWPPCSPAAINAWLLLVTTKPPTWRDPLVAWEEHPPTLGRAPEGFWYPDPLGFWAEVRRWALELFRVQDRAWGLPEALSLTTLLHMGAEPTRLHRALELSEPRTIVFLDEPSWERSGLEVRQVAHHISDPHRRGQVYEGFWGHTPEGLVVGKAPQHPTTHNLYRTEDMLGFLHSAPRPSPAPASAPSDSTREAG